MTCEEMETDGIYITDRFDTVPGCPNFRWWEGYSNKYINGLLVYREEPIPSNYVYNAWQVFKNLQIIRDHFNTTVIITWKGCLYREEPYNTIIGGAPRSRHKFAKGVDCTVSGINTMDVYRFAKDNTDFMGFGIISPKSIHLDLRKKFWFQIY